jgi:phenylacetate-coenzyme A ligase PaaK-like adenylate-forming protein
LYERSFSTIYQRFIGNPEEQVILALLPNYLEQGNSSLVYMVDNLIKRSSELSGFILDKKDEIKERYDNAIKEKKKVVVFGVSYSLLDLAEAGIDLSEALIIETGGMKGRRKEMSKEEIHKIICQGTGVRYVSSEYGMTELLSQAYSDKEGKFTTPEWMKVFIRDINDPFAYVENGKSGGINVIDLANLYSCSFIATQDLGKIEGDQFSILGRFDNADIRGCNLMVE